jgi:prepilin peptidase CpaA
VLKTAIWSVSLLVASCAGVLDWRSRRIPNWLTVPGLLAGLVVHWLTQGWRGGLFSLEGAGLALGLLLPLVLLQGLGGGDWKLMGALGAWLGPEQVMLVLLAAIFLSGLLAVVEMIRRKRVRETLGNLWELVRGFFIYGLHPHPEINLENPAAMSLPFGVAVAAATLLCFCAVHAGF